MYASQPEIPVLKSVSFFFPAGETTFVIGKSGSGKSTLGQLLMRFYLPTSGEINIDGNPIESLSINWVRNNITLLEQKSVLFNESILTNIGFGRREGEPVGEDNVQEAIDMAMLQSTIDNMPCGIDTCVGSGGGSLSGGQRQRIAIARARLRDTPILILDEPTSALDSTNRIAVMKAIRGWRKGKTTFVITHDMAHIHDNDFVYVMEHGSIVQSGYRSALERGTESNPFVAQTSQETIRTSAHHDPADDTSDDNILMAESLHETSKNVPGLPLKPPTAPYMQHQKSILQELLPSPTRNGGFEDEDLLNQSGIPMRRLDRARVGKRRSVLMDLQDRRFSVAPFRPIETINRRRSINPYGSQTKPERLSKKQHETSIYGIMKTIVPNLTSWQRLLLLIGFVCTLSHASATPLFSYCMSELFGTFYDKHTNPTRWSLAILGVAIGDATVSFFMHYLLELCGEAWVDSLRKKALRCVLDQPKQWFEDEANAPSKLIACLDQNGEDMRDLVGRFAGFVLVASTITVLAVIWSLVSCWKLTLVTLLCGPVIYAIMRGFEGTSGYWEKKCNEAGRVAGEVFVEAFSEIRTVRTLTLESFFHKKHINSAATCMKMGLKRAGYTGVLFGLAESTIMFVSGEC